MTRTWFVYIVRCADNTLYTGIALDVMHRICEHNTGNGAKYTRSRSPVTLVYQETAGNRSAASKREHSIKKLSRAEKEKLLTMKSFEKAQQESTCQKRITVCEIYDKDGKLLSRESNRCNPTGGTCARLGITQNKTNYDVHSECNWTHAEIMAVNALPPGAQPYRAALYGHDFYCKACEQALKDVGVKIFTIH